MGRDLSHDAAAELLGAYALDAVDGEERSALSAHVQDCLMCQRELAEYHEVAGFLVPGATMAPDEVWTRISGLLEEAPPPLKLSAVPTPKWSNRGRVGPVVAAALAAAAVAVIAVLGLNLIDDESSGGSASLALEGAVDAALDNSAARRVDLRSATGDLSAEAVLLPDGTGYMVSSNLPSLPTDDTYQLWAVVGESKISVGVLGPAPGQTGFKAAGEVSALAITREPAGGVVASDQEPIVLGTLS